MSMYSDGWSPADALAMISGRNNGDGGLFGGEGIVGLIALIIISGMFGFGGFGMGGMGGMMPWLLMSGGFNGFGGNSGAVTRADMCSEFNFNGLENSVRGVQRAIDGVNYNMATNTCTLQNTMNNNTRDIIDSQNAGTRAIPAATTINAPVIITIGTGTQQYPLTRCNCSQVTACGIRISIIGILTRTRYSTVVSTNATGGTFKMLGRPCCSPNNALNSINGTAPAAPATPTT